MTLAFISSDTHRDD